MKVSLIENKNINIDKWDKCAINSDCFELYYKKAYLDCVFPKWKALIAGDYEAIYPIFEKKYLFWNALVHPIFTGPITILGNPIAQKELRSFYNQIINKYTLIDSNISIDLLVSGNGGEKRKIQKLLIPTLGFTPDKPLRKNNSKAIKAGISFTRTISSEEFCSGLFENLLKNQKILSNSDFLKFQKL